MADPKEDSLAQRATALQGTIGKLLENRTNAVSGLVTELRALSDTLRRVPRWIARTGANNDLRNLAEVTLIRCEPALKLIPNIPQNGPELENEANKVRPHLTAALAQLLSFGVSVLEREDDQIAEMQGKVDAMLAKQSTDYSKVLSEAQAALTTANKAAATAAESAKKVGITVHMTAFSIARDSHRKWSHVWAALATAVATALLLKIAHDIQYGAGPPNPSGSWYIAANLSHYLARALCVSLVSYVLVFCTKNYRAAKHNEVVNAHRAGALATFDTLKSGAQGHSGVDDAITLHVAEAVFTPQPSGYDGKDAPETHVTELMGLLKNLRG
jgi:hypothetical protein